MKLNGRELEFRRTIYAEVEVAKIAPERDPNRIAELLQSTSFVEGQMAAADFIRILNTGYEKQRAFREPGYEPIFLETDDILTMEDEDFTQAFMEAYAAWSGEAPTVNAEPIPEKGKKKQGKRSK